MRTTVLLNKPAACGSFRRIVPAMTLERTHAGQCPKRVEWALYVKTAVNLRPALSAAAQQRTDETEELFGPNRFAGYAQVRVDGQLFDRG